jgi:glycosyltransferase involved in cell wall biosynthesis
LDPTIVYVGDLSERYGPDLLMKAMPAILRRHPQARCVFVGDGDLLWPLRVYARYLLLDYAVRIVGHVEGQALHELIQAADAVAVPSRESTPWWPILAGWGAQRPVIASRQAATPLLQDERDGLLFESNEQSCAEAVMRLLDEPQLARTIADGGKDKLEDRRSWNIAATQIEEFMRVQHSWRAAPSYAEV